jgi:epoxyqueuosine reductase
LNQIEKYTQKIKAEAKRLGFFACGVSQTRYLYEEAENLQKWLKSGSHGEMNYMENHFDKRLDPRLLVPGAKSIISVLYNYFPQEQQQDDSAPILSKYAYGEDYHFVLKDKMKQLFTFMKTIIGDVQGRIFTDSAPVLDKKWAEISGIAWRGKHSNMLTRQGSFFFIGELIIDAELDYDEPMKNYCGTCTRCIDACPTKAITEPYVVDGSKCISYFTIELKGKIPEEMKGQFENRVFGCDICQDVCPYNKNPWPHSEKRFIPPPGLLQMVKHEWYSLSQSDFNTLFSKSAVLRTGYSGLKRNLDFLKLK